MSISITFFTAPIWEHISILPLLTLTVVRQSVYSRLAGYEDTNDAQRLARDRAIFCIGYGFEPWSTPRRPVEGISSQEG